MANDDFARGLLPINTLRPGQVHYYRVSSGRDIYLGDLVTIGPTGYVTVASDDTAMVPAIGVAVGFLGVNKGGLASNKPFLDVSDFTPPDAALGSGDRWIAIADDPNIVFRVQEDTGGTALALADIGASCDLVHRTTVGNTDTGWANLELDASDVAATTGGSMMILGLSDLINSDGTRNSVGDYAKWDVRILHHQKLGGTTGAAV